MRHFEVNVFSKEGRSEYYPTATEVHETLRQIGLEWKTADWAHDQEVVISIKPFVDYEEASGAQRKLNEIKDVLR